MPHSAGKGKRLAVRYEKECSGRHAAEHSREKWPPMPRHARRVEALGEPGLLLLTALGACAVETKLHAADGTDFGFPHESPPSLNNYYTINSKKSHFSHIE